MLNTSTKYNYHLQILALILIANTKYQVLATNRQRCERERSRRRLTISCSILYHSTLNIILYCSIAQSVQCSIVQCSVVQCSMVQSSLVQSSLSQQGIAQSASPSGSPTFSSPPSFGGIWVSEGMHFMCVYAYIYIYIYIHTYTHTYIHTIMNTHIMYVCMYVRTYVCMCIYIYIYTHVNKHVITIICSCRHPCGGLDSGILMIER